MYKVSERFTKVQQAHPHLSSYVCFARAVAGTGLSENTVRRQFYKLVDPGDYAANEARQILDYLVELAKPG